MHKSVKGKRALRVLRILVTLGFLVFLIDRVPWSEVTVVLLGLRVLPFCGFLLISALMIAASTWKWGFLLHTLGIECKWTTLYKKYLIAYFYTNLLPSTVGGDVYRTASVGGEKRAQSFAAVFVERGSGLIMLILLSALSPLFLPPESRTPLLLGIVALFSAGCLGLLGCLCSSRLFSLCQRVLGRFQGVGIAEKLEKFAKAIKEVTRDRGGMMGLIFLTLLFHILVLLNVKLGFIAMGREVSYRSLMGSVFPVILISTIPVSINGLGLTEGAYVWCLGLAGVDPASAATLALLLRAKSLLIGLLGGVLSLPGEKNA